MEADFRREYGIRLRAELPSMSWREFMVLVRGLGPQSATVLTMASKRGRNAKGQEVRVLTTTEEAERAFAELFGPKKPRDDA